MMLPRLFYGVLSVRSPVANRLIGSTAVRGASGAAVDTEEWRGRAIQIYNLSHEASDGDIWELLIACGAATKFTRVNKSVRAYFLDSKSAARAWKKTDGLTFMGRQLRVHPYNPYEAYLKSDMETVRRDMRRDVHWERLKSKGWEELILDKKTEVVEIEGGNDTTTAEVVLDALECSKGFEASAQA